MSFECVLFSVFILVILCSSQIILKNCTNQYLSSARDAIGTTALSENNNQYFVVFAGSDNTSIVDVFNVSNQNQNSFTTNDSKGRKNMASTSWNHLAIFAGGTTSDGSLSDHVDVFDTINNKWLLYKLSQQREFLAAVTLNNITMFAGGESANDGASNIVDIWNHTDNKWSINKLSIGRKKLAGASAGTKILFAGGYTENPSGYSNRVDIWDYTTNKWSISKISQSRQYIAGASATPNIACFAIGGGFGQFQNNQDRSNIIDIYNDNTKEWSIKYLTQARSNLYATNVNNRYCVFGGGTSENNNTKLGILQVIRSNKVDVYDGKTDNINSTDMLMGRTQPGLASVFNIVMIAGGNDPQTNLIDVIAINDDCGPFK